MTTLNDKDIIAVVKKDTEKGFRALMAKYKEPVYWHIAKEKIIKYMNATA